MSAIPSNFTASLPAGQKATPKPGNNQLTPAQQQQVQELKKRDTDVRLHEAAHLAAAGGLARSGASFTFQTGPDGKQYAVGGDVQIDTSPVPDDPQATIAKMRTVQAAALAPADPSSQDRAVAAQAAAKAAQAQTQLGAQNKSADSKGKVLDTFA
jgi:hypothetical protein